VVHTGGRAVGTRLAVLGPSGACGGRGGRAALLVEGPARGAREGQSSGHQARLATAGHQGQGLWVTGGKGRRVALRK